jgi:hypothetical protein
MASRLEVDDELWAEIGPLIAVRRRRRVTRVGCRALTAAR